MTINPYEPPQVPRSAVEAVPETDYGPWHHHGVLVVDVRHLHRLPQRCVLTGVDVASDETRRMKIYFRGPTPSQSSIKFDWPLSRAARPNWRLSEAVAWGCIALGVGFFYRYLTIGGSPRAMMGETNVELLFIGAGLASFGFVVLNIYDWRPLSFIAEKGDSLGSAAFIPGFWNHCHHGRENLSE